MGHFKERSFGFVNILFVRIGWNKGPTNVFPHIGWWYKYWPLLVPPHPHPRRQHKSPARGQKILKNKSLMIFHPFYLKSQKSLLPGGLKNLKINYLIRNHDFFIENT